jgi:hypothetical protein
MNSQQQCATTLPPYPTSLKKATLLELAECYLNLAQMKHLVSHKVN